MYDALILFFFTIILLHLGMLGVWLITGGKMGRDQE